jgi:hypothetical protein
MFVWWTQGHWSGLAGRPSLKQAFACHSFLFSGSEGVDVNQVRHVLHDFLKTWELSSLFDGCTDP